jgi:phosphoribosyl 1,2-cyclic phosphodiesterase
VQETQPSAAPNKAQFSNGADVVRVRFWGVRGSIPAPGPSTVRYGGNTSCVTVEVSGHDLIIFDAGSGIRELGLHLLREKRLPLAAHVLLTHTHWDHIQGFPFFVPAALPGNHISIYGAPEGDGGVEGAMNGQMIHRYFPVSLRQLGATLTFQQVEVGRQEIAGLAVTVAPLSHSSVCVGYRIEAGGRKVTYLTDAEPVWMDNKIILDKAMVDLATGADVLIHDAQYTDAEYRSKIGWGHSPTSYVVDVALAAQVKHLVLFHHDPNRTDDQLDALVVDARQRAAASGAKLEVSAAYEGLEITLPAKRPRSRRTAFRGLPTAAVAGLSGGSPTPAR